MLIACKMKRIRNHHPYKYVSCGIAEWKVSETEKIIVPKGFLTDGSSGGHSFGFSWLIHDFLYSSHKICGRQIKRREADRIMIDILKFERAPTWYVLGVKLIFKLNPFWLCSKAWKRSGKRGPEFLHTLAASDSTNEIMENLAFMQR